MHLSLFTTFCAPNILVFPLNIFDRFTPLSFFSASLVSLGRPISKFPMGQRRQSSC